MAFDAFEKLPQEKKDRIINAGLEVFAAHEYKYASTDDMAAKAGISKGLLFYYFKNKKEFFLYLIGYAKQIIDDQILDDGFRAVTDFFELMEYSSRRKAAVLCRNPHWIEFAVRAFYSVREEISPPMAQITYHTMNSLIADYFGNVDLSKFKPEVDPQDVLNMLLWMTDGYMHQRQTMGQPVELEPLMTEYRKWQAMLRQVAYKEEYL